MTAHGIFEALMGIGHDGRGIALYDVVDLLPTHRTKRYHPRPLDGIRTQYVHHSGALRKGDPFNHMRGSARFVVQSRQWPGFAYTTWLPFFNVFDDDGNRVVYRGNPTELRTFHGGQGPNRKGVAHCLQGNLTARDMSETQANTLPVTLRWFAHELAISPTPVGHFQIGPDGHAKATCPGRAGKAWVQGYQAAREAGGPRSI